MRTVVIYRSETGFTRQYALWLAEELGCEAVDYGKRKRVDWDRYDTVIYGGWFHAGGIRGLKWFQGQLPRLAGKRLAVFAVGACPVDDPGVGQALENNLPGPLWAGTARFYLRGGLCYERMRLGDRLMMAAFRQMLKKKEGPDGETLRGVSRSFDALDRGSLAPIVAWAKKE